MRVRVCLSFLTQSLPTPHRLAELEYLAAHPENKSCGIGSMLVTSGIAQAEKLGVDIYMMACKAGLHMYQRLGFDMLEYKIQDDSKWGGKGEYGTYFLEKVIVPRDG